MLRSLNILLVFMVLAMAKTGVMGFVGGLHSQVTNSWIQKSNLLRMASDEKESNADRLQALGYSDDEIRRSQKSSDEPELKVRVDLIDDVDPVSLTAIGFGLIAFNFLVFANMGDGGIAGLVATIINTINQ